MHLNNKPHHSNPSTALQPSVNPWPPMHSLSELFHLCGQFPAVKPEKSGSVLFHTFLPLKLWFSHWSFASELSFRASSSIMTGGINRTCPALDNLLNLMQDFFYNCLHYTYYPHPTLFLSLTGKNIRLKIFHSKELWRSSLFFDSSQFPQPHIRTMRAKVLNNSILTNPHIIRLFIPGNNYHR